MRLGIFIVATAAALFGIATLIYAKNAEPTRYPKQKIELYTVKENIDRSQKTVKYNKSNFISDRQRQILTLTKMIKDLAEPYDLVETITAIAWVESEMGLYNVNVYDPSCGITAIHLKFYMKAHNIKQTKFNANATCQRLMDSPGLAITASIENLLYWKSVFCNPKTLKCTANQYQKIVKAYNVGYNINTKAANEYYAKVQRELKILRGQLPTPKERTI